MWKSGSVSSRRSCSVQRQARVTAALFAMRLAWVSIAPLERPVVPEVYPISAISPGAGVSVQSGISPEPSSATSDAKMTAPGASACWSRSACAWSPTITTFAAESFQNMAQFGLAIQGIDKHHNRADHVGAQVSRHERRTVFEKQRHPVTAFDSCCTQPCSPASGNRSSVLI